MKTWDLTQLYDSFVDSTFINDFHKLDRLHEAIELKDESEESLIQYLKSRIEFEQVLEKIYCFIQLSLSVNTSDKDALKYDSLLEEKQASYIKKETVLNKKISTLDFSKYSDPFILEHLFILEEIKEMNKYQLEESEEAIIANMRRTGSSQWAKYKDQIISSIKVDYRGKTIPLTSLLNLAYDKDKDVRFEAYYTELEAYKDYEEGIAQCLNGIKGEVLYTTKLRGYNSELERNCIDSRLSLKTLETLLEVMQENLDIFQTYLKTKAQLLGYDALPWYELYAPVNNDTTSYTYEEACEEVKKCYYGFSQHMGDFASKAMEHHWLDVEPRAGKVGGAFCENIISIKESRILLNFGGHYSDVVTMAHELGHGFHGECLKDISPLNTHYPMPVAETASTLCETITNQTLMNTDNKELKITILENSLSDATQTIVDIYSRFLFESRFYELRQSGPLSVEEIKELMLEAQKEAYGESLDPQCLHPYMWTWKPHYYDPDYSFYNYPYAFGILLAKGLYALYLKDKETFPRKYEYFLSQTGSHTLEDVCKEIGINITEKSFWQLSMDTIRKDVELFQELTGVNNGSYRNI